MAVASIMCFLGLLLYEQYVFTSAFERPLASEFGLLIADPLSFFIEFAYLCAARYDISIDTDDTLASDMFDS